MLLCSLIVLLCNFSTFLYLNNTFVYVLNKYENLASGINFTILSASVRCRIAHLEILCAPNQVE